MKKLTNKKSGYINKLTNKKSGYIKKLDLIDPRRDQMFILQESCKKWLSCKSLILHLKVEPTKVSITNSN